MKKSILIASALTVWLSLIQAQTIEFEKTHDISKKAAKGILADVTFDDKKNVGLVYITGARTRKFGKEVDVKKELYAFDKDYNFIGDDKDVDKYISKKKPKKKGENYSEEYIEPDINFSGTFMVRKVRYNYKWSRYWNDYEVSYDQIEKVKPRDSKDRKLLYKFHTNNTKTGDMVAFTLPQYGDMTEYTLLTVKGGTDISISNENLIKFDVPHIIIGFCYAPSSSLIDDNDEPMSDAIVILQPMKNKKGVPLNRYTYLRFDAEGKVLAQNTFEVPYVNWDFYLYPTSSNELYLVGRANRSTKSMATILTEPYFEKPYVRKVLVNRYNTNAAFSKQVPIYLFNQSFVKNKANITGYIETPVIRATKATDMLVAYFKDDKLVTHKSTDLKELNKNIKVYAPKVKKPKSVQYSGYTNLTFAKKIDDYLFIGTNVGRKAIEGYQLMQISTDGSIKTYQVLPEQKNKSYGIVGTKTMVLRKSKDGGYTWIVGECEGADTFKEGTLVYVRNLYRTRVGKINTDGSFGTFTTIGKNEKGKVKYFIDEDIPILENESDYMVLFGRDTGDDTLWFAKITY